MYRCVLVTAYLTAESDFLVCQTPLYILANLGIGAREPCLKLGVGQGVTQGHERLDLEPTPSPLSTHKHFGCCAQWWVGMPLISWCIERWLVWDTFEHRYVASLTLPIFYTAAKPAIFQSLLTLLLLRSSGRQVVRSSGRQVVIRPDPH